MQSLTEEKCREFFTAWAHAREEKEYLAYDVTSISSYGIGNENLEYGYNRDGEDLPQINLGMYYGEESMLPIYYRAYPGSINDKSHLKYMMADNERLGIHKVKFVMDRGFFSAENIRLLVSQAFTFIIAMPNRLRLSRQIIDRYRENMKSSKNYIQSAGIYAVTSENTDYGFRCYIHLYYSSEKAVDDERSFYLRLDTWEKALLQDDTPKGAEKYFTVTHDDSGNKQVSRNFNQIDNETRYMGFFLIMTTDFNLDSVEVLTVYRMKDVIEKCFSNLKNKLDMKRLRVHSSDAADGKLFISFLALILISHVENTLRDYIRKNDLSTGKIFRELRKIKVVETIDGTALYNPLTKRQRDILAAFNKTEEHIRSTLEELIL